MAVKLSATNFVASASSVVGSSEDSNYPATNLETPERPGKPWKTTALGSQNAVVDFGSAQTVQLLILVDVNYTGATIQGNATNSWGAPSFSQAITPARHPVSSRYMWAGILSAFNYRYLRLLITAGSTTDGASVWRTGGLWGGPALDPPSNIAWTPFSYERHVPRLDVDEEHGAGSQRLILGLTSWRIAASRVATHSLTTPVFGDQADSWLDLDRQLWAADHFALWMNLGDPAQAGIVRQADDVKWDIQGPGIMVSSWELRELVGP